MRNARTVPLPVGSNSLVLTGQAFDGTPRRVICSVHAPAGGLTIGASIVNGSATRDGFTVYLTAAPLTPGYRLSYWASISGVWELETPPGAWEIEAGGEAWELES